MRKLCRNIKTILNHDCDSAQGRGRMSELFPVLSFLLIAILALTYRAVSPGEWKDLSAARYLEENTEATDNVLVLGNNVWCYLLADRKTSNPFFLSAAAA